MKFRVTFTADEIAELLAQRVATLFQVPAKAEHVKRAAYSWDGYTVELDDEAPEPVPEPITHPVTDDLGDAQSIAI